MAKCEWCGKQFDKDDAAGQFSGEYDYLSYGCFRPVLCFDCAVTAIEEGAEGAYFDTCEACGRTFDFIEDKSGFEGKFPWYNGVGFKDYWDKANKVLCADCAMAYVD